MSITFAGKRMVPTTPATCPVCTFLRHTSPPIDHLAECVFRSALKRMPGFLAPPDKMLAVSRPPVIMPRLAVFVHLTVVTPPVCALSNLALPCVTRLP